MFFRANAMFCNISTITTRNFAGENIDDLEDMIRLNKVYPFNEQRLRNTNCEWTQSLQSTYDQSQADTDIILDAYIGDNQSYLMNMSELYNTLTSTNTLKLYSADYERTLSSLTALLYGFKNWNDNSFDNINDFDVIVHDRESEPLKKNSKCSMFG